MNSSSKTKELEDTAIALLEELSTRAQTLQIPPANEFFCRLKKALMDRKEEILRKGGIFDVGAFVEYGRGLIASVGNACSHPAKASLL